MGVGVRSQRESFISTEAMDWLYVDLFISLLSFGNYLSLKQALSGDGFVLSLALTVVSKILALRDSWVIH